ELVLVGSRAVDVVGSDSARPGSVSVEGAGHSGNKLQIIENVAPVHGDLIELFAGDQGRGFARVGLKLDQPGVGRNGDFVGGRSDGEHQSAGAKFIGGVEHE